MNEVRLEQRSKASPLRLMLV